MRTVPYTHYWTTSTIKKTFTPPRGMFRKLLKNSVYEEKRVLVFLDRVRNNYGHTFSTFFKKVDFIPKKWHFSQKSTPPPRLNHTVFNSYVPGR